MLCFGELLRMFIGILVNTLLSCFLGKEYILIINGKLISARYFANEISKLGDNKTHIWLKFTYQKDKELIVFLYPSAKTKNIIYPHSSSLGAEISVSDQLYSDIKYAVLQGSRELADIGIVIGSDDLTDDVFEKWISSDEYIENENVDIDELSIAINHPSYTEAQNLLLDNANTLIEKVNKDYGLGE